MARHRTPADSLAAISAIDNRSSPWSSGDLAGRYFCAMEVTETLDVATRSLWRSWLVDHHATKTEIWLIFRKPQPQLSYIDSVYEALCFGWIDGIGKRIDSERLAQRFTPRRPGGNWTELNKERCRRLITQGLMTPSGEAVLPDLTMTPVVLAADVAAALQADPSAWQHYQAFPDLYQRIRIGYIEEVRKQPDVFASRLTNFVKQTSRNKMFGGMD
jgi:uncharacterized protein YdeI (YjbR/CyaY-like superfamily)